MKHRLYQKFIEILCNYLLQQNKELLELVCKNENLPLREVLEDNIISRNTVKNLLNENLDSVTVRGINM